MRRVVDDVRGMVVSASLHASNLMIYKTRNQKARRRGGGSAVRVSSSPATSSPAHRRERTRTVRAGAQELEPRC